MPKRTASRAGFIRVRGVLAVLFGSAGIVLAMLSIAPPVSAPNSAVSVRPTERARERYMPVAGERGDADDLNRLEQDWNNRVTYPTGRFDPAWLQAAVLEDAKVPRAMPAGAAAKSLKSRGAALAPLALNPGGFTALGPAPLRMTGCSGCYDYTKTEGRVNDIVVDPTTTSNGSIVAYLGSDGGGVWKTTNCCTAATSWTAVTDVPVLSTISIDSLTIDPNNHNTIYAGTGDLNFGSFSMGSQGVLKSTDGGAHWALLGQDVFGPALPEPAGKFPQYNAVGKVRVDPRNSNNVVAGTKTGLYFSYDGGGTWAGPCTTNNYNTMRQDITGLVLSDTGSSTRIIAAVGVRGFSTAVQYNLNLNGANGLYRATMPASGCPGDFTPITTNANGWTGLNTDSGVAYGGAGVGNQVGRIDIAVAPSNPNYIYAQLQAITAQASCGAAGCQLGAYRSTDGGTTWSQIPGSTGAALTDCAGSNADYNQNWYDQGIAVDPNNPDRVFFDTFEVWFWQNGNSAWNDVTCGYNSPNNGVHVDQHALAFVPGSSSILLIGNDGGVHATTNASGATGSSDPAWFNMDNGLNTIEFYSGDISANFATSANPQANGGAQDNGASAVTFSGTPTGPVQWQMGVGGDGFFARIDPVGGRFWQGNNGGQLNYCDMALGDCTTSNATWLPDSSPWTNNVASPDIQSFVLPYEIYKGIPGDLVNDCPPAGCGHLIVGTQRVWETVTSGNVWYPASMSLVKGTLADRSYINQLAFEPKDQSRAMVGTNDGNVQYGHGLGVGAIALWVDLTGGNAVLPNRPVLDVAMDPTTTTAPVGYAAVGGFNANTPATPGHVFQVTCTTDCASFSWGNKTGNLPDIPVDSIIANPKYPQQVFAGTDWGLYYTNDITASAPTWYRFQNGLPSVMIWDMQIDRGNSTLSVWTRSRGAYVWPLPSAPLPTLTSVVSRKAHGAAGNFDIDISAATECRSGGANNDYTLVFTFSNPIASCGTANSGTVSAGPNANQCTVQLTGVPNAQSTAVTLTGVTDTNAQTLNASGTMGLLIGDTTNNKVVNASDVSQTQSESGHPVSSSNFREDVTVNGSVNSSDVGLVQSKSGTGLP